MKITFLTLQKHFKLIQQMDQANLGISLLGLPALSITPPLSHS